VHLPPSIGNVPAAVDYPSPFGPADAKDAESARRSARLDPNVRKKFDAGAGDRNRTRNLLFTKQLLCQLSYAGVDREGSGTLFGKWISRASPKESAPRTSRDGTAGVAHID